MTKRLRQDFERDSIMSPFCYFGSILECSPEMFIMCVLFVNPIQSCSGLTPVCSDTTLCHLLVLSKTGTCFSQSGTFSSRRHPINLGINSLACATMVMLTEWRLPCHFRFVPRRESIHAVCCLADLPELAHWHLQKKKKSTLISPYVWVAVTTKHGQQKWGTVSGAQRRVTTVVLDGAVVSEIKPCVSCKTLSVNAGASDNILKQHSWCQFQYADNTPDGGDTGTAALGSIKCPG